MNTCWKCRATLRVSDAAFCPACGTSQKRDGVAPPPMPGAQVGGVPPGAGANWGSRIEELSDTPSWGMAIVWTVLFPLAAFSYPFLLFSANSRLRRHVAGQLASPSMQSPRVTQTPEGKSIRERLAGSVGSVTTAGVLPLILSLALLMLCVICLFIIPANAPRAISYSRAVESVLEGRPASGYVYVNSADQYNDFWSEYDTWSYDEISVSTSNYTRDGTSIEHSNLPTYSKQTYSVSSYEHPPYEYISDDYNGRPQYNRVSALYPKWDNTLGASVTFWIAATALYLTNLIFGLVFWFRFMRHRQAQVLAAAYAVGDPAMHDRLLPPVKQRNTVLACVVIPLSLLGLQIYAFPILRAAAFTRHAEWERRTGILAALLPAKR